MSDEQTKRGRVPLPERPAAAAPPSRQVVRFVRPTILSPTQSRAVESYTGEVKESPLGLLLVEHQARVPWGNVAIMYPPGASEADIRRGPTTQEEELGIKDKRR